MASPTQSTTQLAGKKLIPIRKTIGSELQELTKGEVGSVQDFLQVMEGL